MQQQHPSAKPIVNHQMLQDHVSRGAADIATLGESLQKSILKNINSMSIKTKPIVGHVNGERNLGENQKLIMNKFIEASEGEAAEFNQKRNRVDNLQKHRKAIALLQEIENGGKKSTRSPKPQAQSTSGQVSPETISRHSRYATKKKTTFAEEYADFHDEHDSDVAEAKIFKNLDNQEEGNKQQGAKKTTKLPEMQSTLIQPFKGTKFEHRISPIPSLAKMGAKADGEKADGTFEFTKQE